MPKFKPWRTKTEEIVNNKHDLKILTASNGNLTIARDTLATIIPDHYASGKRIANLLKKLRKPQAAQYILQKLPKSKNSRSGDLGEIIGTRYVEKCTPYDLGVNRLRWKDHRNMAMRGDDLIAFRVNPKSKRLEFLKGEVKSRATLSKAAVNAARLALRKDKNRPSPHALSFVADRLYEQGETDLADAIEEAQLKHGIALSQMAHLLFTFTGNDPTELLRSNLQTYQGNVTQYYVGLWVSAHQKFIKDVYDLVIKNAVND